MYLSVIQVRRQRLFENRMVRSVSEIKKEQVTQG